MQSTREENYQNWNLHFCGILTSDLAGIIPPHPLHCKCAAPGLHRNPPNSVPAIFLSFQGHARRRQALQEACRYGRLHIILYQINFCPAFIEEHMLWTHSLARSINARRSWCPQRSSSSLISLY